MNTLRKSLIVLLLAGGLAAGAAEPTKAPLITQEALLARLAVKPADVVVLDVRTPAEFAAGHVPGARNVSHDELPARLGELAALKDKPVVLYCRSGRRTQIAEDTLRAAGFTQLLHLDGDWLAWEAAKRPVEPLPAEPLPAEKSPAGN
jgi:rhodanese-related sulfurtransferase